MGYIILNILITASSAEWGFSKLKLIKFYLHSTTSQEILNNFCVLSI